MSPHEDPQLEVRAREIGAMLDRVCKNASRQTGRRVGFMLMLFDMGTPRGFVSYMANANRDDTVTVLEEWIAKVRAGEV